MLTPPAPALSASRELALGGVPLSLIQHCPEHPQVPGTLLWMLGRERGLLRLEELTVRRE